ncbi:MAG TPA: DUF1844 domain-containing protein [Polyangia bacterium]|nr:DUF1844 domain-containing protein [Polyangia bacterium]
MSEPEDKAQNFTVTDRRGQSDTERYGGAKETSPRDEGAAAEKDGDPSLPAIDFATFILSLASSVLVHLGELESPEGPQAPNLPLAKQTIDILGLLSNKTRGNLTAEEDKLLTHLLYDLRLKYVDARKRQSG